MHLTDSVIREAVEFYVTKHVLYPLSSFLPWHTIHRDFSALPPVRNPQARRCQILKRHL